jgi:hypothetical protein
LLHANFLPLFIVSGRGPDTGSSSGSQPDRTVSSLSLGLRAAGRVAPLPAPAAGIQAALSLRAAEAATTVKAPVIPGLDPAATAAAQALATVAATTAVTDVRPLYAVLLASAYSKVVLFSHLVIACKCCIFNV